MEKKSIGRRILGDWSTKTIVAVAIGAALFGVLMVYAGIPTFTNTNVTPAMLIPILVGAYYGPLPAMVCCGIGNIIADLVGGWGMWFDWSIANALLGFFTGFLPIYGADIKNGVFTKKHAVIYVLVCLVSNALVFIGITPFLSEWLYATAYKTTVVEGVFATLNGYIMMIIVGLPVLFLLARRNASRMNIKKASDDEY